MDTTIITHLTHSATLLTPTRRLASRLKQEMSQYYASIGKKGWETPRIYALSDWLTALWQQYEMMGEITLQLLTPTQTLLYWQQLIQSSEIGKHLLHPATTAKLAAKAWLTLNQWQSLEYLAAETDNKDHATFQDWARDYKAWLEKNHFTDQAQLPEILLNVIIESPSTAWQQVSPTKVLILYSFDDFTPQESHFLAQLQEHGWQVQSHDSVPQIPKKIGRLAFEQSRDEWQAAAKWVGDLLRQGQKNIAVVIPTLVDNRLKIATLFKDTLSPLARCRPDEQVDPFINISAAVPLGHYSIIYAAIGFLKLGLKTVSLPFYAGIMCLPFSKGGVSEAFIRASYAFHLKKHSAELACIDFIAHSANKPPLWESILRELRETLQQLPKKQRWGEWASDIKKLLQIFGWPGERALNSIEYQTVKRWEALLNELGLCDEILPQATFPEVLSTLEQLAANTPFQPENKHAPVQLLGLLEAAGQHFDYLWIMGLHSEAWPPKAEPNPFIPIPFQRQLNMPHAGPEKEMAFAAKLTQRLKQSAKEIYFSYSLQEKGRMLEASELIQDLPLLEGETGTKVGVTRAEELFSNSMLEQVMDDKAPALTQGEMTCSTATLACQSACPFKAFAQFRLGARLVEWQDIWLAPPERGTLIHGILEDFWTECQDQQTLLAMDEETLQQRMVALIDKNLQIALPANTPTLYLEAEANRLYWLMSDYVELEKSRAPFKVVALETEKTYTMGDITFKLRLDRIDQSAEGDIILIDYKTGQFQLNSIWGERPKEPQLPLYFLATQELQPRALVVAKVNSKKCEFIGVSYQGMGIPGVNELAKQKEVDIPYSWEALNDYWSEKVGKLAFAFQEGQAQVDPRDGAQTCQFCHLSAVCRVHEYER